MDDRAAVSDREQRVLELIETRPRSRRAKFRDAQITMAHGAGGQGDPDADRGAARARRSVGEALAELADAGDGRASTG